VARPRRRPLRDATRFTPDGPPFLIIHGEKDGYSPVEQALVLDAKLKAARVSSQLVIVQNGEHGLNSLNGNPTIPSPEEISRIILEFLNAQFMK
jgi:dipeptidyl aminopeptidase/acylaminoacyl peptidase